MAKLSGRDKAVRVLELFLGLRNRRIAALLMAHGLDDDDLAEGWSLLQKVTRTGLAGVPPLPPPPPPSAIDRLDAWENKWFPIAAATLQRRAPEVHAALFAGLARAQGIGVVLTVTGFVRRFEGLAKLKKDGGHASAGVAAKKILEKRGLTASVIAEAKELLAQVQELAPIDQPFPGDAQSEAEAAQYARAEVELWAWYLEWSVIARRTVKDRNLLRQLGFLKGGSGGAEEAEPTVEAAAAPVAPPKKVRKARKPRKRGTR